MVLIISSCSIAAALIGAILLTLGITYTRWAKSEDWKSDDIVIVQAFTSGEGKGINVTEIVE